ncbi:uncharacterized protein LOC141587828 [Silene latifolia]|uniref:uncharacterized protein LOC141587828 n=1 Tax=Silene latifolia TaxID=37657 RepID=UPI003D77B128
MHSYQKYQFQYVFCIHHFIKMPETFSTDSSSALDYYDDPLFLSTSDQPTATLASFLFDGHDFLGWKREVLMSLAAKNKDGLLDGSCVMPSVTDKRHKQWKRCDFMVMRWLSNSLEKGLRENFKYVTSSESFWHDLLERYGQSNALEVYQLTKDLGDVSQDNLSLVEYYGKMKNLWETLDCLDPLPTCSCGKISLCTCSLLKKIVERENNAKVIQFLMNLNNGYDGIRTQILSMEPLPTMNKVLSLLQKIERQKQITETVAAMTEANAYASFRQYDSKKSFVKNATTSSAPVKHCDHCNKNGHTRETCFGLTKCPHCQKTGHNPANCFVIRGFPNDKNKGKDKTSASFTKPPDRGAHDADVLFADSPLDDDGSPEEIHNGLSANSNVSTSNGINSEVLDGIITSVIDQVLKRISDQQPKLSTANFAGMISSCSDVFTASKHSYSTDWIIDTGASDHMTFDKHLLTDIHYFSKPIKVGLPDGSVKFVHMMGTVVLTDKISLFNVFYVPDFRQNLLSVSKLTFQSFTAALVYVDDVLLTGTSASEIDSIKRELHSAFSIKDLGEMRYFLGLEISRNKSGLMINQRKYILDILQDLQMEHCSGAIFPMQQGLKLSVDQGELLENPEQ